MQQIKNFKDLKTALNKNGKMIIYSSKDKITLMKLDEYNKKAQRKDIEEHLLKAEDDIKNGRVHEAKQVFYQWKQKYDLQCSID